MLLLLLFCVVVVVVVVTVVVVIVVVVVVVDAVVVIAIEPIDPFLTAKIVKKPVFLPFLAFFWLSKPSKFFKHSKGYLGSTFYNSNSIAVLKPTIH